MENKIAIDWALLKSKLREALFTLPHFLKNPIEGMKHLPHWGWAETLILQSCFAAICGVVKSLVEKQFLGAIFAVILFPLSSLLLVSIFTGLFFYGFHFLLKRELSFHRLYINVLFAGIPIVITSTITYFLPPISLIGVICAAILLYVGLVEEFRLPKDKIKKILGAMVFVYLMMWVYQLIQFTNRQETFRLQALPESMEILEKDFKN